MIGIISCSQTQNGGCSSASFIMEIVRYLGSPPPPFLLSFWQCTFQREQSELASLLALWMTCWKELLWIGGGGGIRGWQIGRGSNGGGGGGWSFCPALYVSAACYVISPLTPPLLPVYQRAAASPGSCISHARPSQPLFDQEGAQKVLEKAEAPHRVQWAQRQRAKRPLLNEACRS